MKRGKHVDTYESIPKVPRIMHLHDHQNPCICALSVQDSKKKDPDEFESPTSGRMAAIIPILIPHSLVAVVAGHPRKSVAWEDPRFRA